MSDYTLDDYIHLLANGTPAERRNAAWMLGRQRDFQIIDPLLNAIHDEDDDTRLRVVEALGNIKDERIVPSLIRALSEDVPRVRAQVAMSLGFQRDYRALEALIELLNDGEAMVRGGAVQALFHLPDARAISPVLNILADDPDPNNRHYAARTLEQIGGEGVVSALSLLLLADPDADTKIRCVEVLAALRYAQAIPALRNLQDDADEGVREMAKWALKLFGE
jgi:HEAT repeat protein